MSNSPALLDALLQVLAAAKEVQENCISTDDYSSAALFSLSIAIDEADEALAKDVLS